MKKKRWCLRWCLRWSLRWFLKEGAVLSFLLVGSAGLLLAQEPPGAESEAEPETRLEPTLEPADLRPPPGSGRGESAETADRPDPPASAGAPGGQETVPSPGRTSFSRQGRFDSWEEIPRLSEEAAGEERFVFLGTAPNGPVLLYRVNRLPAYLPLGVVPLEKGFRVYAGPLSPAEQGFMLQRREYLWRR